MTKPGASDVAAACWKPRGVALEMPPKINKSDKCGKCGRTREKIVKEFQEMMKRGVRVIGGPDVLLWCSDCKKWFCGRCQVDLGMSSGCPNCRKALD